MKAISKILDVEIENLLNYDNYISNIVKKSIDYLRTLLDNKELHNFLVKIEYLKNVTDEKIIIEDFSKIYISFIKDKWQTRNIKNIDKKLDSFIHESTDDLKIIWGHCYDVLKKMKNESVGLMITSPPYYNAREYSQWNNLKDYLKDMKKIIKECYRVLDNHRVFVFNIGDIFGNDNLKATSTWGNRRIPLSAYFINIFEEIGFTFVDDFIWDKGQVQSERHKNGNRPYPFYQYPINCYEHIFIFHKHRLDPVRYPCPVCGTLKVNGNSMSEIGLRSWECKNTDCFNRSPANRGKRFSLKTITTQKNQSDDFVIERDLIEKWRRDIIKFSPVIKINSKGENTLGHTAPFPEDIPYFATKLFSYEGDTVLDPFAGSFTSAIVANKLGRNAVGIEYNKDMFRDNIIKNISSKIDKNKIKEYNINEQ